MQVNALDLGSLTHMAEAGAGCKWNGSGSGKDLGRVVQKYLVDHISRQCRPIYGGSAFDHHAGDFEFTETSENCWQIGPSVRFECRNCLDLDSHLFQLRFFLIVTVP